MSEPVLPTLNEFLDELFERSKNDHAMIVGSEVRMAVQAARNAIRERDQLRECVKTLEDALRDEWMPCSSLPEDGMEEVFAQTHDGDTLLARCMFDYDADNQPERVWWSINNDQEIYRVARWKTRAALTPNKEKL